MKLEVDKIDVWVASIEDRPGALAEKLESLAEAGANLEFVVARRAPEQPGTGVVFVAPLSGAKQTKAAKAAGFEKAANLGALRIKSGNAPGVGAQITRAVADAGINLRGISGATLGRQAAIYLSFDSPADAAKAQRVLKKL